MSRFAERLKELRLEKNLSQRQLAPLIGFRQPTICDWESGEKEPSTHGLIACAIFFDVSTDYLLGLEKEDGTKINISNSFNNFNNTNGKINIKG